MEYNRENFVTRWEADEDFVSEARSVEEESNPEESVDLTMPQGRPLREALVSVDASCLEELVSKRATVMKNVTRVVKKDHSGTRLSWKRPQGRRGAAKNGDGKCFFFCRMLLHTPPRG